MASSSAARSIMCNTTALNRPTASENYQFTNGFTTKTAKNDGTGDALATMLLGLPQIANRAVGPSRIDGRQWSYSAYIQDDVRLTSKIILNLGLRYELAPPMYDDRQQMSSVDYSKIPSPQSIFAEGKLATYKPTLFICGQSGYAKGCANTDKNNFAPRVGVVWSATPKTVVKVGSGIFYALNDLNPLFRLAAGLPGNIAQTVNSDNYIPKFQNFDVFGPAVVSSSLTGLQAAGIDYNQRTSYSIQWNASVQRELAKDLVIEVGYLASLGFETRTERAAQQCAAGPRRHRSAASVWRRRICAGHAVPQLRERSGRFSSGRVHQFPSAFGAVKLSRPHNAV